MLSARPEVQLVQGNFARVRVRTQDVIVITSPVAVPAEIQKHAIDAVQSIFRGNPILFLDEGMQIGALAPMTEQEEFEADEEEDAC